MDYNSEVMIGTQALNILTRDLKGKIYSVHSNSFYCVFTDEQILLIHEGNYGIIPFGIAINGLNHFLAEKKLKRSMAVVCHNSNFYVPEINFVLYLSKRGPLPSRAGENSDIVSATVVLSNLHYAINFLMHNGSKAGLGGLVYIIDDLLSGSFEEEIKNLNYFCRICYKHLSCLLVGIAEDDYQNIGDSLERLMGLGPGLTPSMDDILVGLVCTLWYVRRNMSYKIKGLSSLGKLVLSRSNLKTSLISAAYLKSAAQGENFTLIDNVIQAILNSSLRENLSSSFNQLIAVGSNSGTEMFLGIILALRLVFKENKKFSMQQRCD